MEVLPLSELRQLDRSFFYLPCQALHCSMPMIKPLRSPSTSDGTPRPPVWPNSVSRWFGNVLVGKPLHISVISSAGKNTFEVDVHVPLDVLYSQASLKSLPRSPPSIKNRGMSSSPVALRLVTFMVSAGMGVACPVSTASSCCGVQTEPLEPGDGGHLQSKRDRSSNCSCEFACPAAADRHMSAHIDPARVYVPTAVCTRQDRDQPGCFTSRGKPSPAAVALESSSSRCSSVHSMNEPLVGTPPVMGNSLIYNSSEEHGSHGGMEPSRVVNTKDCSKMAPRGGGAGSAEQCQVQSDCRPAISPGAAGLPWLPSSPACKANKHVQNAVPQDIVDLLQSQLKFFPGHKVSTSNVGSSHDLLGRNGEQSAIKRDECSIAPDRNPGYSRGVDGQFNISGSTISLDEQIPELSPCKTTSPDKFIGTEEFPVSIETMKLHRPLFSFDSNCTAGNHNSCLIKPVVSEAELQSLSHSAHVLAVCLEHESPVALKHGEESPVALEHGEKGPVAMGHGEDSPVALEPGEKDPVALEHGEESLVAMEHGEDSPVALEPGEKDPVALEHGEESLVAMEHGEKGPVALELGVKSPVAVEPGEKYPIALEHGEKGQDSPVALEHNEKGSVALELGVKSPVAMEPGEKYPVALEHGEEGPVALEHGEERVIAMEHAEKGPVALELGVKSPVAMEPGEKYPIALEHGEKGPVAMGQGEDSPVALEHNEKGPVAMELGVKSPVAMEPGKKYPIALEHGEKDPVAMVQGEDSPVALEHGEEGPVALEHGEDSPVALGQGEEGPVPMGLDENRPVALEQGEESPVAMEHGEGSPVAAELDEKGPVTMEQGEDSPVALEHNEKGPVALEHGAESLVAMEDSEKGPVAIGHGEDSPVALEHNEKGPVALELGGKGSVAFETGEKGPVALEYGEESPVGMGHGEDSPVALEHYEKGPVALELGVKSPVALEHGGKDPVAMGQGEDSPVALEHGGKGPVAMGQGEDSPVALEHGEKGPVAMGQGKDGLVALEHGEEGPVAMELTQQYLSPLVSTHHVVSLEKDSEVKYSTTSGNTLEHYVTMPDVEAPLLGDLTLSKDDHNTSSHGASKRKLQVKGLACTADEGMLECQSEGETKQQRENLSNMDNCLAEYGIESQIAERELVAVSEVVQHLMMTKSDDGAALQCDDLTTSLEKKKYQCVGWLNSLSEQDDKSELQLEMPLKTEKLSNYDTHFPQGMDVGADYDGRTVTSVCMDVIATISPAADNFDNVAVAHSIEGVEPAGKEDLLATAVGEMEGIIGAVEGTIGAVEGTISAVEGTIGAVEGTIGAVEGTIGAAEGTIGAAEGTIGDVERHKVVGDVEGTGIPSIFHDTLYVLGSIGNVENEKIVDGVRTVEEIGSTTNQIGEETDTPSIKRVEASINNDEEPTDIEVTIGNIEGHNANLMGTVGVVEESLCTPFICATEETTSGVEQQTIGGVEGIDSINGCYGTASGDIADHVGGTVGHVGMTMGTTEGEDMMAAHFPLSHTLTWEVGTGDEGDCTLTQVLGTGDEGVCPSNAACLLLSWESQSHPCKPIELGALGEFVMLVSHVNSPSQFYVHPVQSDTAHDLDQLVLSMSKHHSIPGNLVPLCPEQLVPGSLCSVWSAGDGLWCRGVIVEREEGSNLKRWCVFFVDYGDVQVVDEDAMFVLDPALMSTPAQCVCCSLCGVKPPRGEEGVQERDLLGMSGELGCVDVPLPSPSLLSPLPSPSLLSLLPSHHKYFVLLLVCLFRSSSCSFTPLATRGN